MSRERPFLGIEKGMLLSTLQGIVHFYQMTNKTTP